MCGSAGRQSGPYVDFDIDIEDERVNLCTGCALNVGMTVGLPKRSEYEELTEQLAGMQEYSEHLEVDADEMARLRKVVESFGTHLA